MPRGTHRMERDMSVTNKLRFLLTARADPLGFLHNSPPQKTGWFKQVSTLAASVQLLTEASQSFVTDISRSMLCCLLKSYNKSQWVRLIRYITGL